MPHNRRPVAAILGPTAVGKSRIAVDIAPGLGAEIVSVDSMQVYSGMDIGTAKPDRGQRSLVPHHLLDVVDPCHDYSASLFQHDARRAVEDIASREKLPLLVGGTGLYFEATVFDLRLPPGSQNDALRKRLEDRAAEDPEGLRRYLREIDPAFAAGEGFDNLRRVIRAVEVYERTGEPFSSLQRKRGDQKPYYPYVGVVIDAPREELYEAIERRVDDMIAAGMVDEVRNLAASGGISRTARQALGYKEILDHLDMGIPLEETILYIKRRSRNYAKRQLTWFRRIPGLRWYELAEGELADGPSRTAAAVRSYFEQELEKIGTG